MDSAGRIWDAHGPIHGGRSPEALARSLGLSPGSPAVLDAVYLDQGQETWTPWRWKALNQSISMVICDW